MMIIHDRFDECDSSIVIFINYEWVRKEMDKNEREKKMLYEFGVENCKQYHFQEIDEKKESYFLKRKEDSYIREYAFETLPEFMEELNTLWNDDEMMERIKKVIGVAAIKNKPIKKIREKIEEEGQEDKEEKLPAFIYNF